MPLTVALSIIFLSFLSPLNDSSLATDQKEVHLVDSATWHTNPVSPSSMNQRVEETAKEYKQYAPIPRLALYDIAFPKNTKEFEEIDGYSVLLLVVITQDSSEIPPTRVFARNEEKDISLTLISSAFSKTPKGSLMERVLGPNRWEGLYLLPTHLIVDSKELLIDFAAHRKDFVFAPFSEDGPPRLDYLSIIRKPMKDNPPSNALIKLIEREFPGFIQK